MHRVSQVVSFRRRRYTQESRQTWLKLGLSASFLFSLVLVGISFLGIVYAIALSRDLPSVERVPRLLDPSRGLALKPTRLLDRSGQHVLLTLEDPAAVDKQFLYLAPDGQVGISQVNPYLVNATILELDPDFWSNSGFKLSGVVDGTHPTIAQILVSDLLLTGEPPSIQRNIRERILAAQLVSQYGRKKVMEWYLNSARYGEYLYGADAAARVYFGKPAAQLSFAETAMLLALAENPLVDPLAGSQLLAQQQKLIIQKMLVAGLVTPIETQQALTETVRVIPKAAHESLAPAFTSLVLEQLDTEVPLGLLYLGGYDIITSLDYNLQAQVDCAARSLVALRQGDSATVTKFDEAKCKAASYLPTLSEAAHQSITSVDVEIIAIDPRTGQVLAMIGINGTSSKAALPAKHQAGTVLSPFLYLAAFSRGMSPATLLWDIPPIGNTNGLNSVSNPPVEQSVTTYHGPVSIRQAMVNDYPGATALVLNQVGADEVFNTEAEFGITPGQVNTLPGDMLAGFESQDISLLEVVGAYAVLANRGVSAGHAIGQSYAQSSDINPTSVLIVKAPGGLVTDNWTEPAEISVTSPQLAYLVTHVLSDNHARKGSAVESSAAEIGSPVTVKFSSADTGQDAWTVGYTPGLTVGVWFGTTTQDGEQGSGELSAGLWHAVMSYAAEQMPGAQFVRPSGVSLVQVCEPSGLLPSALCPSVTQEVFLEGTQPTQQDNLYQQYSIDRETGYLATIFTPPDLVENKVYLNFPAELVASAKAAGLAVAPDQYDSIDLPSRIDPVVNISSPQMFEHVHGKIEITGSAGGDDFSFYRLEIGKGLNPKEWLQLGEDSTQPVIKGSLGVLDTTGLEGLYVIKLMVVRQNMRFDEAFLQVTIDNITPVISILFPQDRQNYRLQPGKTVLFNVSAIDNLAVDRIEFYLDGRLGATAFVYPYVWLWDPEIGQHTLRVEAYDLAGNISQASVTFVVSK